MRTNRQKGKEKEAPQVVREKKTKTRGRPNKKGTVKFGTEFTFYKQGLTDGIRVSGQHRSKPVIGTQVLQVMDGWKTRVTSSQIEDLSVEVTDLPGDVPQIRFDYAEISQGDGPFWWWVLSVDDGVFETQTKPSTYNDFVDETNIAKIVDLHIFDVASSLGLEASNDVGGGHISIDLQTGFQHDIANVLRFVLQAYDPVGVTHYGEPWSAALDTSAPWFEEIHDEENAAKRLEIISKLSKAADKASPQNRTSRSSARNVVNVLNQGVFDEVHEDIKSQVEKADYPHYQAINVEHINEEDPGARRVELRRIAAQPNRRALLRNLDSILSMLPEADNQGD